MPFGLLFEKPPDAVESHNPDNVDKVLSFIYVYIYCTEILMGLPPCANNEIGGGMDCYPFNKNYSVKRLKQETCPEKTREVEKKHW